MAVFYGVIIFIFGTVLGSFINCMAGRVIAGKDWIHGMSHCEDCGHVLSAKDLVPVLSYISTGGKCRYCGRKVSIKYPITEIIFGLLMLFLYMAHLLPVVNMVFGTTVLDEQEIIGSAVLFLRDAAFTGALFTATLTDLDDMTIPDGCIIFGVICWLITAPFLPDEDGITGVLKWMAPYLIAAALMLLALLIIACVMDRILKRDSLGGGDIKLLTVSALYLGPAGSYELILFSCMVGLIFVFVRNKVFKPIGKEFPFGPSIAFTAYVLLIFEKYITAWYFSLLS